VSFDLIIFDCDGVLVDSEVISCRAHAEVLTYHGYPITSDQVLKRFLGVSDREARQTIERDRPVAFIESVNHYTGDLTGFLKDYFLPLGYQCWHYITPLYNAQNFNRFDQNVFTGAWSFDLLCTPRERFDVSGLANAETHPTECHDPELWRSALVTRKEPGTHA
jgi:hypothetical protein